MLAQKRGQTSTNVRARGNGRRAASHSRDLEKGGSQEPCGAHGAAQIFALRQESDSYPGCDVMAG